jgi:D-lactate dehydrogenase
MRDLKDLLDPDNLLNPGVILNPDPHAHLRHIKPLPLVDPLVDRCIECGFCEPKCPSRDLTLTPRQRIAVSREMARLRAVGDSPALLAELQSEYPYAALETCAADGMCATDCPVSINTGKLVKHLRSAGNSPRAQAVAGWVSRSFHRVESGLRLGVWAGHAASSVLGVQRVVAIEKAAGRALNAQLPLWSAEVPRANFRRLPVRRREAAEVVYFPSCITRVMGSGLSDGQKTVIDTLVEVADCAGIQVYIPPDSPGNCCGMPFSSKGFDAAYRQVLARTLANFWDWSDQGRLPVVIDSSSCAYTLRSAGDDLEGEALHHWQHITFLDPLDFLHDLALPNLTVHRVPGVVALHPNCSAQKEGLANKMVAIARACAEDVFVPLHLNCCGFAGDRGLLFPELTASAASAEAAEVNQRSFAGYYSSNLTCEMGMTRATGKPYQSIVYLVEAASR